MNRIRFLKETKCENVQFFESKKAEHNWLGIPVDGLDQDGEAVSLYDPWGKHYHIKLSDDGMTPTVWSSGRDGIDGTTDDILLAQ